VVRRRLRRAVRPHVQLERQPDDLPKTGLFVEPLRVTRLDSLEVEPMDARASRVTFMIEVRDAEDKRCSDIAVDARVTGPERAATVQATTDMFGRARFRMTGPAGPYAIELLEVAAKALAWDRDAGPTTAEALVAP
jgi:hypothetical protein